MPFGLCNAPAMFQRLMDLVLAGLQWSHCLVYIDDAMILGTDFETHLQNLEVVLHLLHKSGLKVQPSKCYLFQHEVNYLGHIISQEGIAADPTRLKKWLHGQSLPQPKVFGICQLLQAIYQGFCRDCQATSPADRAPLPLSVE